MSQDEYEALVSDNETTSKLLSFAHKFVRDPDDAEDVLQDSLIRAWRFRDSFRGESEPETWLHAIVRNTALTTIKKKQQHKSQVVDRFDQLISGRDEVVSSLDADVSVDEAVISQDEADNLKEIIGQHFPKKTAVALGMIALGFTYKEIAERLQCRENAAKTRVSRARAKLRQIIDNPQD